MPGEAAAFPLAPLLGIFFQLGLPVLLLVGAWLVHRLLIERRRQEFLARREAELAHLGVSDLGMGPEVVAATRGQLVTGTVVVANNYFISFCSALKNLFGGEMTGYTGLCTDARRLALVRLLEEAEALGAVSVCNLRYEMVVIQQGNQKAAHGVELIAYGTALFRD